VPSPTGSGPRTDRHPSRLSPAILTAAALISGAWPCLSARAGEISIRRPKEVEFTAIVHPKQFDSGWSMPGYHAIVWMGGRAAHSALLEAEVSDRQVIRALEELGAKPGNNLSMDAWEERKNPANPGPDVSIVGTAIEVLLRLPGRRDLVPLAAVLQDPAGRGLDLRYGGNERNIPKWESGCIVCLYSCPGSKVGNARYTVRDYARGTTRFRSRPGMLPPEGTRVGVVLRIR
jgi:hypothetical protein